MRGHSYTQTLAISWHAHVASWPAICVDTMLQRSRSSEEKKQASDDNIGRFFLNTAKPGKLAGLLNVLNLLRNLPALSGIFYGIAPIKNNITTIYPAVCRVLFCTKEGNHVY